MAEYCAICGIRGVLLFPGLHSPRIWQNTPLLYRVQIEKDYELLCKDQCFDWAIYHAAWHEVINLSANYRW